MTSKRKFRVSEAPWSFDGGYRWKCPKCLQKIDARLAVVHRCELLDLCGKCGHAKHSARAIETRTGKFEMSSGHCFLHDYRTGKCWCGHAFTPQDIYASVNA